MQHAEAHGNTEEGDAWAGCCGEASLHYNEEALLYNSEGALLCKTDGKSFV